MFLTPPAACKHFDARNLQYGEKFLNEGFQGRVCTFGIPHAPIAQLTRLLMCLEIVPLLPTLEGHPAIFNPCWFVLTEPVLVFALP